MCGSGDNQSLLPFAYRKETFKNVSAMSIILLSFLSTAFLFIVAGAWAQMMGFGDEK